MRAVVVALVLASAAAAVPSAHAATWCGTDAAAVDRLPEAVSSNQIHVIYAYPANGVDRFAALAPAIVADLTAIDVWWRSQDSSRTPRFDVYPFPNCPQDLSRLDLSRVELPADASFYAPLESRFPRVAGALAGPPFAFSSPFKKYLVYYDGPVEEPGVCGESIVLAQLGGPRAFSLIFLGARCPQDLGSGALQAAVAAHELSHNLGALVPGAPNACPQDGGHSCDSDRDLMFPFLRASLPELFLDAGHDDYYRHSSPWWDVQDSEWLAQVGVPQPGLSVSLAGSTGTGIVRSDRPGIDCPAGCSIAWEQGTAVTLTAEPGDDTRFAGWSGACRGIGDCLVAMDAAKTVGARFVRQVSLRVRVVRRPRAAGSVASTPSRISCPSFCAGKFDQGVRVTLRAKPKRGSRFAGWTGACRGTGVCSLRLTADATLTATFRRARA